jgi:hypothetical protein
MAMSTILRRAAVVFIVVGLLHLGLGLGANIILEAKAPPEAHPGWMKRLFRMPEMRSLIQKRFSRSNFRM